MPEFMTAYYAAVCTVQAGDVDEIELMLTTYDEHDRSQTLMVTIRREVTEAADAA
jgi:hypothetical protein